MSSSCQLHKISFLITTIMNPLYIKYYLWTQHFLTGEIHEYVQLMGDFRQSLNYLHTVHLDKPESHYAQQLN